MLPTLVPLPGASRRTRPGSDTEYHPSYPTTGFQISVTLVLGMADSFQVRFVQGRAGLQHHDGGVANKTDRIIVRCPSKSLGQIIELGKAATGPGEIDYIEVVRGNVTITHATGLNEVHTSYVDNPSGDVELTINSGVATIPLIRAMAGRLH